MTDRTESDRKLYAEAVLDDMKQLSRLLEVEPALSVDEMAHRMAWKPKDLRKLLKMMRVQRG